MKLNRRQFIYVLWTCIVALLFGCGANEGSREGNSEDISVEGKSARHSTSVIDVWYGKKQIFGFPGIPQQWINILGNVSDPAGMDRLSFSLNSADKEALSVGPDGRRLVLDGDFNIEINRDKLNTGLNSIAIYAVNQNGSRFLKEIEIEYKVNTWPLPYTIDWSHVSRIQKVVQIVDGLWFLDREGIRTHPDHVGYDRVVAIGDRTWKDYEVTVSFKIHGIDASAYGSRISKQPAFGLTMRWLGHTDTPVKCIQPHCGWMPFGGSFWYKFQKDNDKGWRIIAGSTGASTDTLDGVIKPDTIYRLKARVVTGMKGDLYQFKVWEDEKEREPFEWMLEKIDPKPVVPHGSFLLVAHHVDMTFGNVEVVSVNKD